MSERKVCPNYKEDGKLCINHFISLAYEYFLSRRLFFLRLQTWTHSFFLLVSKVDDAIWCWSF